MGEALRMVATLVVTCVVAGLALAGIYTQTTPVIAAQEARALQEGLAQVLSGADQFEEVPAAHLEGAGTAVRAAWVGLGAGGETRGWVVEAVPTGYGDGIRMLVGVAADGRVERFSILSAPGETPGLGSKVTEPAFINQFEGLGAPVGLATGGAAGEGEVQAITGATISSRAVVDGVNQALDAAAQLMEKR